MSNFKILDDLEYDTTDIGQLSNNDCYSSNNFIKNFGFILMVSSSSMGATTIINSQSIKSKVEITTINDENEFTLEDYSKVLKINHIDYNRIASINKSQIIENLLSFKTLNENWDGYGAMPLEVKSAANAIRFISWLNESITEPSDYFPNPHGTISFIWENEDNERLSLEIGNKTFSFYVKLSSLPVKHCNKLEITNENFEFIKENIQSIS